MEKIATVEENTTTLSELIDLIETHGETVKIMRSGQVVASVSPEGEEGKAKTGAELAKRMKNWPRLLPGDADDFGRTIEEARANLIPPDDPWA